MPASRSVQQGNHRVGEKFLYKLQAPLSIPASGLLSVNPMSIDAAGQGSTWLSRLPKKACHPVRVTKDRASSSPWARLWVSSYAGVGLVISRRWPGPLTRP